MRVYVCVFVFMAVGVLRGQRDNFRYCSSDATHLTFLKLSPSIAWSLPSRSSLIKESIAEGVVGFTEASVSKGLSLVPLACDRTPS